MAHEVFIGYSTPDKKIADDICSLLENKGIGCWIAPRDVPIGRFGGVIVEAVSQSKLMVFLFSDHSNRSANCLTEVHTAFNKGIKIITLRLDDTNPSDDMEYYLQLFHWMDARQPPIEKRLEELVNRVQRELAGINEKNEADDREEAAREKAQREAREAKKAKEAALKVAKKTEKKKPLLAWLWLGFAIMAVVIIGVALRFTIFSAGQSTNGGEKETAVAAANTSENTTPTQTTTPPTTEAISTPTPVINYFQGYVRDSTTNAPIKDALITVYESFTTSTNSRVNQIQTGVFSDRDGYYEIPPFNDNGTCFLRVSASGYFAYWYLNASDIAQGTPLYFKSGNEVTTINFLMIKGGSISGRVVTSKKRIPIVNPAITIIDPITGTVVSSTRGDMYGFYSITGLPAGNYFVIASGLFGGNGQTVYYLNSPDISTATQVSVYLGKDTPDINLYLSLDAP